MITAVVEFDVLIYIQGASLRERLSARCKLATWTCQEPRHHAAVKQSSRHMHEYTAYIPVILYLRCTWYVCVCLEACDYRAWPLG